MRAVKSPNRNSGGIDPHRFLVISLREIPLSKSRVVFTGSRLAKQKFLDYYSLHLFNAT
jgi:hypothetical protein